MAPFPSLPSPRPHHAKSICSGCAKVLRDLGISEARLQNSLVEVWNKTDLLQSDTAAAAVTGRQAESGLSQKDDGITLGTDSNTNKSAKGLADWQGYCQQRPAASHTGMCRQAHDLMGG